MSSAVAPCIHVRRLQVCWPEVPIRPPTLCGTLRRHWPWPAPSAPASCTEPTTCRVPDGCGIASPRPASATTGTWFKLLRTVALVLWLLLENFTDILCIDQLLQKTTNS